MVKLTSAQKAARKAVESTYTGVCAVVEYHDIPDEKTGITRKSEVTVIKNQPCKLSFEKLNASAQTDTAAALTQGVKLFIAPEIKINPGSKIIVEQNCTTTAYSASGKPAVYFSHQEITLELLEEWA